MRQVLLIYLLLASFIGTVSAPGQAVDPRGPTAAYTDVKVTRDGVSLRDQQILLKSGEWDAKEPLWKPT